MASFGFVQKKTGDLPGALFTFTKIAGLVPNSPEAFQTLGCVQNDLLQYAPALESMRKAVELDPKMYYPRFHIWLIRGRLGEKDEASKELAANIKLREGEEGHKWQLCIAKFLVGDLAETNFLTQATETAVRPTDEAGQQCESYCYAGMKRLLNGDKSGAGELFGKCAASGQDNYAEYASSLIELREMKKP
jgi:lipoprotein NlpI